MGCTFTLGVISEDEDRAMHILQVGIAEIVRIERLLSEFLPDSEVSKINNHPSDSPITIDAECFHLIDRSEKISQLTHGAFDITVSPLKQLYQFSKADFEFPSSTLIEEALTKVGYSRLTLDYTSHAVQKSVDMRISFAAIGKGYASDRVKALWQSMGVTSGFVNASGDLNAFGFNKWGNPWRVGIPDPENQEKMLFQIPIHQAAVATSGDAEQYFIHDGKRYSHNINPFTGLPLSGVSSVTVISPSAELSDALATAVYVMGVEDGMAFIDELPRTHCIMIDDQKEVSFSKDIEYEAIA
ncbi:MAG: FAD:protein FMN transferase [Marinoscillum sp.]|uniref:FAD:protein FMN transferase n=1 Tax=Marinoscillum sp. TaxID=2024838 RepID=UPI00330393F6